MEHIEEMFEQYSEKHPILFWLLVRLAICFCWMFVVIFGLLALLAVLAPFFGAMIGVWVLVPILIVACWASGTCAVWLYTNAVESW